MDKQLRVLVTAGSKHGSTAEIASAIARRLRISGLDVDDVEPARVDDISSYDAVILGSAVYAGRWTASAKEVADKVGRLPLKPPTWLFSSGPIGEPPKPDEVPVDVAEVMATTAAREHVVFSGKVDRAKLSFGERAILVAVRAPEGDFRSWAEIDAWSDHVVRELAVTDVGAG